MSIAQGCGHGKMRRGVMHVIRIEKPDHHSRVEVNYSHSARSVLISSR